MDGVGGSDEECVCGSDLAAAGFCGCYSYISDYPLRIYKRLRPPFCLTVTLPGFGESVSPFSSVAVGYLMFQVITDYRSRTIVYTHSFE